jgi:drug/metabolite transporter (DMT)-like permease
MSLILHRGLPVRREAKALGYAAATAVMIAGYTVVDGLGVRVAASVLGYAVYLFVFEGVFFTAIAMRGRAVIAYSRVAWKPVAASALFSSAAYALVLWALTLADMALVSALRETSVLFGALMGTFLLREALGAWRISSAAVILTGLVLLHG